MKTETMSYSEEKELLDQRQVLKIQGRDKRGRKILQIIGKFFPARRVSSEGLKKYLEEKVYPVIGEERFSVLYINTGVQRGENFPGISTIRCVLDAIPIGVKDRLESVFFLHPGIQSRLFLATFGRLLFAGGLYGKIKYVTRTDFLWEHVKRKEMEMPEFVYDHDEELEYRTVTENYGSESDHLRIYGAPALDSSVAVYSMRCIAY